jgi:OmcA/MtrC family decaheme c-type cytochrome
MTAPSRVACGSCHDAVDWVTGAGHVGGAQANDAMCAGCHPSTMGTEFDNSVPGAHVVPYQASANPNLALDIYDVQNMTPGNQPSISFTIDDSAGPVDINNLELVLMAFGGPTDDYTQLIGVDHRFTIFSAFGGATGTLTVNSVGDYTYQPDDGVNPYNIPASTSGTWSVGMSARTPGIDPGNGDSINYGANNPLVYIDTAVGTLAGGTPVPRRQVVDEALCNDCHGDVLFHGNLRTNLEYCVVCHNPNATDELQRPGVDPVGNPPETISMAHMIHRVHTGSDQEQPYLVYGFGQTLHDFSEFHFPGNTADCSKCHVNDSQLLPVPPTAEATVINIAGVTVPQLFSIRPPTGSACTGCHDSVGTFAHAELNSIIADETNWAESCTVCHGEDKAYDVEVVHD